MFQSLQFETASCYQELMTAIWHMLKCIFPVFAFPFYRLRAANGGDVRFLVVSYQHAVVLQQRYIVNYISVL